MEPFDEADLIDAVIRAVGDAISVLEDVAGRFSVRGGTLEFDHADIFPDLAAVKLSFRRLVNIVPQNGMILLNGDDPNCVEVTRDCIAPLVEVGVSENCAERIRDVSYSPGGSRFS